MRLRSAICFALTFVCAGLVGVGSVHAEDEAAGGAAPAEAPKDPTRGGWDGFLDPVRDAEDKVTDGQKSLEDATKIHVGAGILKSWQYDTNNPASNIITLHSLDPDHDSPELDFAQISASRPSEKYMPGFGLKLDFGRIAKRIKADWGGNGVVGVGDTFEKNSFEVQDAYLTYTIPDDFAPVINGITFKGGKFATLLGAEVIEPWANYNFSRSFLFGYAIPFTHTGGLMTVPITDKLSVTGGMVVGWDNVQDGNTAPSEIGNITYVVNDMITLAANGITGPEQADNTSNMRTVGDFIATIKPTDKLTFLLNYDYGGEDHAAVGDGKNARWQGFSGVANYAWTDRFSTALRGEWFDDPDGARTGMQQTLWEVTASAKYLITQHVYGQVEYRHDGSNHQAFERGGGNVDENQSIIGFNFAYLWN